MSQILTKEMARNIFYGGSLFFFLLFLALTYQTHADISKGDRHQLLDDPQVGEQIRLGKKIWEENDCIGCHTLLGEGAYFAPELGNVYVRLGSNIDTLKARIKGLINMPATGVPTRRMPRFPLTDEQVDALAQFLKYVSEIKTNRNWPPTKQG